MSLFFLRMFGCLLSIRYFSFVPCSRDNLPNALPNSLGKVVGGKNFKSVLNGPQKPNSRGALVRRTLISSKSLVVI